MSRRFGSPTPYDDVEARRRKQKRYLSRSDEEIRDEMDIGRLSYRAGWPQLLPLPLDSLADVPRTLIPDTPERLEEVQSILIAQDLMYTTGMSFGFTYRLPLDAYEYDDISQFVTLLVTVDTIEHSHKIENTIMRIRSRFREHSSTEDIKIEFLDYRACDRLASFPIHHTEIDVRKQWDEALPVVLSSLEKHEWLTVEVLRRGLIDDSTKCQPTIVISTPTAGDPKWSQTVVPSILTDISGPAPVFAVEILFGVTILGGRRRYAATNVVDSTSYVKDIRMGSSLGLSNDIKGCSTLGGSVTLEGGVRCGITNWHCVRDDRLDRVVSNTSNGALEVGNKTLNAAPQHMVSPATLDHHGRLGTLQEELKESTAQLSQGAAHARAEFKALDEEYKKCDKFERNIGHVYAGSGRRAVMANKYATDEKTGKPKEKVKHMQATYPFPLDWALVRLDKRDVINYLPRVALPRNSITDLVRGKAAIRWTTFNCNTECVNVAKYGRTSGWTLGTINACLIAINPESDPQIAGVYDFSTQTAGACFGVTNRYNKDSFIESGDSGSILVHDGSGTQLGLLFGQTSTGQGMALPLDLIFQDIKKITGKAVIDPPYVAPEVVGLAKYQLVEDA